MRTLESCKADIHAARQSINRAGNRHERTRSMRALALAKRRFLQTQAKTRFHRRAARDLNSSSVFIPSK